MAHPGGPPYQTLSYARPLFHPGRLARPAAISTKSLCLSFGIKPQTVAKAERTTGSS